MGNKIFLASYDYSPANYTMKWLLTDDEDVAKQFDTYQLASIEDLQDWMTVSGEVFNGEIETRDGICKYSEWANEFDAELGPFGYQLLSN